MENLLEERNKKFQKSDLTIEQSKRQQFSVQLRKKKRIENAIQNRVKEKAIEIELGPTDSCEENMEDLFDPVIQDYNSVVESLYSENNDELMQKLDILVIVTKTDENIRYLLINSGIVPALKRLSGSSFPATIRNYALWVFSNLCASNLKQVINFLIEEQMIEFFISILRTEGSELVEYALMGLFNFAAESEDVFISIMEKDFLGHLQRILKDFYKEKILLIYCWGLLNLVHFESHLSLTQSQIILDLCEKLLKFPNVDVKSKAFHVIANLIRSDNDKIELFLNSSSVLILYDEIQNPGCQTEIIRICSNICSGTNSQTQRILDKGLLDLLWASVNSDNNELPYFIYFALSNIAGGSIEQLKLLTSHPIFYSSFNGLLSPNDKVKIESSYIVKHYLTHATEQMKSNLLNAQFVAGIITALQYPDPLFICNLLTVFEEFIKVKGKQDFYLNEYDKVVEQLETHQNPQIYEKCLKILDKL